MLRKYPAPPGAQSAAGVHAAPPTAAASPPAAWSAVYRVHRLQADAAALFLLEEPARKKVGTRRCGTCVAPQVHSPSAAKHSPPPTPASSSSSAGAGACDEGRATAGTPSSHLPRKRRLAVMLAADEADGAAAGNGTAAAAAADDAAAAAAAAAAAPAPALDEPAPLDDEPALAELAAGWRRSMMRSCCSLSGRRDRARRGSSHSCSAGAPPPQRCRAAAGGGRGASADGVPSRAVSARSRRPSTGCAGSTRSPSGSSRRSRSPTASSSASASRTPRVAPRDRRLRRHRRRPLARAPRLRCRQARAAGALRRVAVATTDPSVVRWMQPDYVVVLGGGGRAPLLRSPHAAGAAAAWRPQITIAYSTAAFDEEGEDQADPLLAAVAAGGGRAAHSSAPGYGVAAGGWREARARVVLDGAAVDACRACGLQAESVGQTRVSTVEYAAPPGLRQRPPPGARARARALRSSRSSVLRARGSRPALRAAVADAGGAPAAAPAGRAEPARAAAAVCAAVAAASDGARVGGGGGGGARSWPASRPRARRTPCWVRRAPPRGHRPHRRRRRRRRGGGGEGGGGDGLRLHRQFTSVLDRRAAARVCGGAWLAGRVRRRAAAARRDGARRHPARTAPRQFVHRPPPPPCPRGLSPPRRRRRRQRRRRRRSRGGGALRLRSCRSSCAPPAAARMKELWRETFQMHHYMSSALLDNAVADVLRLCPRARSSASSRPRRSRGSTNPVSCADSRPVRREHRLVSAALAGVRDRAAPLRSLGGDVDGDAQRERPRPRGARLAQLPLHVPHLAPAVWALPRAALPPVAAHLGQPRVVARALLPRRPRAPADGRRGVVPRVHRRALRVRRRRAAGRRRR